MRMRCKFLILFVTAVATFLCLPMVSNASILGLADSFAVLGASTVTNTGLTVITGNVGVTPGTSITGFPPAIVNPPSTIQQTTPLALQAQDDATTAYNALANMMFTSNLTGQDLAGLTLTSGVYHFDSSAQLSSGTLTLDAQNNNNAFWVFQIGSTLTTASGSVVQVINSGSDGGFYDGLFWQVGTSATLDTTTAFEGNIIALASVTMNNGANIDNGRVFALTGAVTLDTNTISNICLLGTPGNGGPGYSGGLEYNSIGNLVQIGPTTGPGSGGGNGGGPAPVPEPATMLLLGTGLAGLAGYSRKSVRK